MITTKVSFPNNDPVAQTLLLPLRARALAAREPDPLLRDEAAILLTEQIDCNWERYTMRAHDRLFTLLRAREFDRRALDFLAHHRDGTVVHIGCGLDTRFQRVDNGSAVWYDLDLPEVIALRRQLLPETERNCYLACSVFDQTWMALVKNTPGEPVLFLAEGVLVYFDETEVRELFLALAEDFPGSELVCDGLTPGMIRMDNLHLALAQMEARLRWRLANGRDPERWGPGIRLLREWFYFDEPEPRLGSLMLLRHFPLLARGAGIYQYRLGASGAEGGVAGNRNEGQGG